MTLYVDVGNTALKWRCRRSDGSLLASGGVPHHRDWQVMAERLYEAVGDQVCTLVIASVAGPEAESQLRAAFLSVFGVTPQFYCSPASWNGLTNAYAQPSSLGVDRWLAMIEAWHCSGASIVIDCGSAITLDVIDSDGRHGGGYIVPGIAMLAEGLSVGTGLVRAENVEGANLGPGRSTSECVHHGILLMCVAFVTDAVVALQESLQDTCSIYMTGGDALALRPYLTTQVDVVPDMVLDGLERIFR